MIFLFLRNYDVFIGLEGRVFANALGDLGSIPGCIIPKTLKIVFDTSLFNTQQYKVKVEPSWEKSSALPLHLSDLPHWRLKEQSQNVEPKFYY